MSWFYALVRSKIINRNFTFMIRLGLCSQKPYETYRLGCRRVRTQSCWDIYPAARYHQLALPVACGSRSNLPRIGQSALVSSTKNWPISARIIYQKLANQRSYHLPKIGQSAIVFRCYYEEWHRGLSSVNQRSYCYPKITSLQYFSICEWH